MAATITLLNSLEWSKRFVYNRQLSIGDYKEPLLTSANIVRQTILGKPFRWQFNRVVTGFVCQQGVQDYTLGSWAASTAFALAFRIIDTNGNSQRVTTAGTSGSSAPSWNGTTGGTTSDGSVTWTNDGPIPHASSTYNFGWIENATVQDIANGGNKWYEISAKVDLSLDSSSQRPANVAAELINADGSVTFRLMGVPNLAYPVALTIQQAPSLFTSLNQTWDPIPDRLGYVYQMGVLSFMYEFADDSRWTGARQRFTAALLGAAEGLSETEQNIFLAGLWEPITGSPLAQQIKLTQAQQARGV